MGTTQRVSPGVKNQPNWKELNNSVTNIAKTIEKESELEQNEEQKKPDIVAKEYKKLIEKRNNYIKSAFKNLIKTGGGYSNVSKGKSSSIGRAGLKTSGKIVNFFSGVSSDGLRQTLEKIGFGSLEGKTVENIIDFLIVYCSDTTTGLDETAANKASSEVFRKIEMEAENDYEKFEQLLKTYADGNGLSNLLCLFWGNYIFEHLSQRFQEKIKQQKGEFVSRETFKIIKDDILKGVNALNEDRPVVKIDWKGQEGKNIRESIFESIIKII
ncbi:MAG: hypothetical protein LBG15_09485 [Dysgonamonadaceae bacterium]|jgi:hypothetical protein|nr:hypothetical protein [Dysgonamonadaceae bacterium]